MSKLDFNCYNRFFPAINSFEEAKKLYDRIVPIRGERASLDIRPIGRRDSYLCRERIIKLGKNEYSITDRYQGLRKYAGSRPAEEARILSFYRNGTVTIHPFYYGGNGGGSCNLISQSLPRGMWLHKHDCKLYLAIQRTDKVEYYSLDPDRRWHTKKLSFRLVDGEWKVLKPIVEKWYRSTRSVTNKLFKRKQWREFEEYVETIWPMVDTAVAESTIGKDWYWTYYRADTDLKDKSTWIPTIIKLKGPTYNYDRGPHKPAYVLNPKPYTKSTLDRLRTEYKKKYKHLYTVEKVPVGEVCSIPRWAR